MNISNSLDLFSEPGPANFAHVTNAGPPSPLQPQVQSKTPNPGGPEASLSPEDASFSSSSMRFRKIACMECRQQKVKCDAFVRSPDPCTRCVKRRLNCSIKSDFKRTYKRARLAAVEKEVEELRRSLEIQSSEQDSMVSRTLLDLARGSTSAGTSDSSPTLTEPAVTTMHFLPMTESPTLQTVAHSSASATKSTIATTKATLHPIEKQIDFTVFTITPRVLDGFTVNRDQIIGLFQEFYIHYHPFFPLVDLSPGPDIIFQKSEILFWVILETASRIFSDFALLPSPSLSVKTLVARQLNDPLRTAYDVQAVLIYTLWPPMAGSLNSDPCWNTCGLAMFNAVKLGLHCPGRTQDFGRVKVQARQSETQELAKTWVACNIVSQFLSMSLGYPAFSMYDWTASTAIDQQHSFVSTIPPDLRVQIFFAKFADKMVKLLNRDARDMCGNVDSVTRRPMIRILAIELDEIEIKLGELSQLGRLLLLITRLQLYAYAFLDDDLDSNSELLSIAHNVACELIAFADTWDVSITPRSNLSQLLYLPLFIQLAVVLAGFTIFKVQFSKLGRALDPTSAKRHFATAITILRKSSIKDNDLPIRISTIMFQVWKLFSKDKSNSIRDGQSGIQSLNLKLRSRMATSVMFDSIWVWRERYG
ncbi:hypothetical protein V1514DRAFT_274444, partial [Lipomyces japonicus]|uniref:uncharacterized protein n=1 Tax=Lipomyces japonicus TaxID=56871 RepID=UPI0034CDD80F